jgi:seryl-tRNA synthetase
MHDIRWIRDNPAAFDAAMARRKVAGIADELLMLDKDRRESITRSEKLQADRNAISKQIGQMKRAGTATDMLERDSTAMQADMVALAAAAAEAEGRIKGVLETLPNLLAAEVPDGADEADNVVIKQSGEPRLPNFEAKQHFELGEALGLMEFERAAKLSGSRFTILRGALARLERALGQFMLNMHIEEHGYEEVAVPLMVNAAAMYGTSQLPKFEEDLFKTTDGRYLIPTAEVPLTNYVSGEIVPGDRLPMRFAAFSQCFRSEAGSAGRDTRGMLRQHQFPKVEMVSICHPDLSGAEHERMTECAEKVLERLEIPYRRMLLCAGDTGFGATKTYDLEVWLPGQKMWREISSCSNMGAFQARRMNARYRGLDGKPAGFVHTLNGSGVAVGRALIAVMENYQAEDGGIDIPAVLKPFMGGTDRIEMSS